MIFDKEYGLYVRGDEDRQILYESKNYTPLFAGIPPGFIVVDIGAHIGAFTALAARSGARSVICYEPFYPSFCVLGKNTALISSCEFILYNLAIGTTYGPETLYTHDNPAHNSTIKRGAPVDISQVEFIAALDMDRPQVVKIDIEGAEYAILKTPFPDYVERVAVELHTNGNRKAAHKNILAQGFMCVVPDFDQYLNTGRCVLGLYVR